MATIGGTHTYGHNGVHRFGATAIVACLTGLVAVRGQHVRGDGLVPEFMIVDLNGDGIRLSAVADGVRFTFAAGRAPAQTAWIARGAGDAFVVIDQNRDGRITSAGELLGGILGPPNGFEYLARVAAGRGAAPSRLDTTHPLFRQLLLWTDANHDGQSSEDELQSLQYAGFRAFDLARVRTLEQAADAGGNVVTRRGTVVRGCDGRGEVAVVTVRLAGAAVAQDGP